MGKSDEMKKGQTLILWNEEMKREYSFVDIVVEVMDVTKTLLS